MSGAHASKVDLRDKKGRVAALPSQKQPPETAIAQVIDRNADKDVRAPHIDHPSAAAALGPRDACAPKLRALSLTLSQREREKEAYGAIFVAGSLQPLWPRAPTAQTRNQ